MWDDVGSFYTRLFGVVYVTRGDFYDGSMKLKLKGRRFDTTEEIQAETQKVFDTLTENSPRVTYKTPNKRV
jgi:hypothetical protein